MKIGPVVYCTCRIDSAMAWLHHSIQCNMAWWHHSIQCNMARWHNSKRCNMARWCHSVLYVMGGAIPWCIRWKPTYCSDFTLHCNLGLMWICRCSLVPRPPYWAVWEPAWCTIFMINTWCTVNLSIYVTCDYRGELRVLVATFTCRCPPPPPPHTRKHHYRSLQSASMTQGIRSYRED